ncbi:MAG: stage III sporulation protein AF [Lachnospiraceae bacterium]|nr:stage III sporulation protein AF [Lachnospiraceae bacterium]
MDGIYGWIRSIIGFLLFLAVLDNLIPGKNYQKYVRLFAGMATILLVARPLTGGLGLEEKIARVYEALVLQYEAKDLKKEILGMEKQRLGQIIGQYEQAVAEDLTYMARDMGFVVYGCRAKIGEEETEAEFGHVVRIEMQIGLGENEKGGITGGENQEEEGKAIGETAVVPVVVEEIKNIGEKEGQKEAADKGQQEKEYSAVGRLRRKIVSYYELEEDYVEIQVIEG